MRKRFYFLLTVTLLLNITACGAKEEPIVLEQDNTDVDISDPVAYDGAEEDNYLVEPEITPDSLWYNGVFRMSTDMGRGFQMFLEKDGVYVAQGITSEHGDFIQLQDARTIYISISDDEGSETHYKYSADDTVKGNIDPAFTEYREAVDNMVLKQEGDYSNTYTTTATVEEKEVELTVYVDKSTAGITCIEFPDGSFTIEPLLVHSYAVSDFEGAEDLPKGQEGEDKIVNQYIKSVLYKVAESQEELKELEELTNEETD